MPSVLGFGFRSEESSKVLPTIATAEVGGTESGGCFGLFSVTQV